MRKRQKGNEPAILTAEGANWLAEYRANKTAYRKAKYRHKDVKAALVAETDWKCVYCESRIGHNTPGDIEHKVPSSVDDSKLFDWLNLTVACTECSRRKNAYFDTVKPFIDPYIDDVESRIVHYGPVVGWVAGDAVAELSVKILDLEKSSRAVLLREKIEKISELNNLLERLHRESGSVLEPVLRADIERMTKPSEKYSAMIVSILRSNGYPGV